MSSVGADVNASVSTTKGVSDSTNTFYDELQSKLNDRNTAIPSMTNISIEMQNNNQTTYNASGNIRLKASIPANSSVPNYCEGLINSGKKIDNSINIVLSLITSKDFICTPIIANLQSVSGSTDPNTQVSFVENVPLDLKKELEYSISTKKQWHTWNLNYNRNYDSESVRKVSAHIISKLNDLIDYVITNDIKVPDEEFRKRLRNIFAKAENNNIIYDFACNTLLLPALVNYTATKTKNYTKHSTRNIGVIKKNSGIFVKTGNNAFKDEIKWKASGIKTPPGVIAPYCIKYQNKQQLEIGAYNYPLCQQLKGNYEWKPIMESVNQVDLSLLKNITLQFEGEKYKYSDPKNDDSFAITTGERKEPEPIYSGRALNVNMKSKDFEYVTAGTELIPTCVEQRSINKTISHSW